MPTETLAETAEHRAERLRTYGKTHGGISITPPRKPKPPDVLAICDDCEHQVLFDGPDEPKGCKLALGSNDQPKPCAFQDLRACPLGKWRY